MVPANAGGVATPGAAPSPVSDKSPWSPEFGDVHADELALLSEAGLEEALAEIVKEQEEINLWCLAMERASTLEDRRLRRILKAWRRLTVSPQHDSSQQLVLAPPRWWADVLELSTNRDRTRRRSRTPVGSTGAADVFPMTRQKQWQRRQSPMHYKQQKEMAENKQHKFRGQPEQQDPLEQQEKHPQQCTFIGDFAKHRACYSNFEVAANLIPEQRLDLGSVESPLSEGCHTMQNVFSPSVAVWTERFESGDAERQLSQASSPEAIEEAAVNNSGVASRPHTAIPMGVTSASQNCAMSADWQEEAGSDDAECQPCVTESHQLARNRIAEPKFDDSTDKVEVWPPAGASVDFPSAQWRHPTQSVLPAAFPAWPKQLDGYDVERQPCQSSSPRATAGVIAEPFVGSGNAPSRCLAAVAVGNASASRLRSTWGACLPAFAAWLTPIRAFRHWAQLVWRRRRVLSRNAALAVLRQVAVLQNAWQLFRCWNIFAHRRDAHPDSEGGGPAICSPLHADLLVVSIAPMARGFVVPDCQKVLPWSPPQYLGRWLCDSPCAWGPRLTLVMRATLRSWWSSRRGGAGEEAELAHARRACEGRWRARLENDHVPMWRATLLLVRAIWFVWASSGEVAQLSLRAEMLSAALLRFWEKLAEDVARQAAAERCAAMRRCFSRWRSVPMEGSCREALACLRPQGSELHSPDALGKDVDCAIPSACGLDEDTIATPMPEVIRSDDNGLSLGSCHESGCHTGQPCVTTVSSNAPKKSKSAFGHPVNGLMQWLSRYSNCGRQVSLRPAPALQSPVARQPNLVASMAATEGVLVVAEAAEASSVNVAPIAKRSIKDLWSRDDLLQVFRSWGLLTMRRRRALEAAVPVYIIQCAMDWRLCWLHLCHWKFLAAQRDRHLFEFVAHAVNVLGSLDATLLRLGCELGADLGLWPNAKGLVSCTSVPLAPTSASLQCRLGRFALLLACLATYSWRITVRLSRQFQSWWRGARGPRWQVALIRHGTPSCCDYQLVVSALLAWVAAALQGSISARASILEAELRSSVGRYASRKRSAQHAVGKRVLRRCFLGWHAGSFRMAPMPAVVENTFQ